MAGLVYINATSIWPRYQRRIELEWKKLTDESISTGDHEHPIVAQESIHNVLREKWHYVDDAIKLKIPVACVTLRSHTSVKYVTNVQMAYAATISAPDRTAIEAQGKQN
ncbi:hypothetical protein L3X38_034892 [Prunus dulcis]|uniref:Uncharacterized protein n=1 Tax=Prunus dulcis TaxID=3755 RepID=A0AAD4VIX0_PRUDU|nr:hypothetical protein L3X38_034892 [Prunus dulcis]